MIFALAATVGGWILVHEAPPVVMRRPVHSGAHSAGTEANALQSIGDPSRQNALPVTPWAEPAAEVEAESEEHPRLTRPLDLWCVTTAGYALDVRVLVASTDPRVASDEQPPAEVWSTDGRLSPDQPRGGEDGPVEPLPPGARAGRHWPIDIPITLSRIWVEVRVPEQFPPRPPDFEPIVREIVAPPIGRDWSARIDLPTHFGWISALADWGEVLPEELSQLSLTTSSGSESVTCSPPEVSTASDEQQAETRVPARASVTLGRIEPGARRVEFESTRPRTRHFEARTVMIRAGEETALEAITVGLPVVLDGRVVDAHHHGVPAWIGLGRVAPDLAWITTADGAFRLSGDAPAFSEVHVVPMDRATFAEADLPCPRPPAAGFEITVPYRAKPVFDVRFRCHDRQGNPLRGGVSVTLVRDGVALLRRGAPGIPTGCCMLLGDEPRPSELELETLMPGHLLDLDAGEYDAWVWSPERGVSAVARIVVPTPQDDVVTFVLDDPGTAVPLPTGAVGVVGLVPPWCRVRRETWSDADVGWVALPGDASAAPEDRCARGLPAGTRFDLHLVDRAKVVTVERSVIARLGN